MPRTYSVMSGIEYERETCARWKIIERTRMPGERRVWCTISARANNFEVWPGIFQIFHCDEVGCVELALRFCHGDVVFVLRSKPIVVCYVRREFSFLIRFWVWRNWTMTDDQTNSRVKYIQYLQPLSCVHWNKRFTNLKKILYLLFINFESCYTYIYNTSPQISLDQTNPQSHLKSKSNKQHKSHHPHIYISTYPVYISEIKN